MKYRAVLSILCAVLIAASPPAQAIVGGTSATSFGQVGSGVQITGNWVITATHLGYGVGSSYSNGYGSAQVAAVYSFSGIALSDDLTLLRLDTPIAAPSLSLNASVLAPGEGYAIDATITTGHNQSPRGYAWTSISAMVDQADVDDAGPGGNVSVNWLVSMGSPYVEGGDSGGGLFLGHVADSAVLWGITSVQLQNDDGSPAGSGFVQLGNYRSWIDSVMAADGADSQIAAWVAQPVPEPASALLLMAGLVVLMRKAHRGMNTRLALSGARRQASRYRSTH